MLAERPATSFDAAFAQNSFGESGERLRHFGQDAIAGLNDHAAMRLAAQAKVIFFDGMHEIVQLGHIQKAEGHVTFHTAASTAFPQPAPGTAPAPGPMKQVPAGELHKYLGIRTVNYVRGKGAPALIDSTLVA